MSDTTRHANWYLSEKGRYVIRKSHLEQVMDIVIAVTDSVLQAVFEGNGGIHGNDESHIATGVKAG